jgi:DNA invertase Pin-like site-specific DNA recombinase
MNTVIYARVSSVGERQSTKRQVADLTDYNNRQGWTLQQVFEEHISGAKKNKDRIVLNECLNFCFDNDINLLLISELSRLGRNVDEVLSNIRLCKENHLNIFFQKEGFSIYGTDGKENPYLTIMIAVLGTCAQLERENIVFRLRSGLKQYVDKNMRETGKSGLGRHEGYRKSKEQKQKEYRDVLKLLRQGLSIRKVSKLTDVCERTVVRIKKEFEL